MPFPDRWLALVAGIARADMGFFDWLFGRIEHPYTELPDLLWCHAQAKWQGLARQALEASRAGGPALVVAHFSATLETLAPHLEAAMRTKVAETRHALESLWPAASSAEAMAVLVSARVLSESPRMPWAGAGQAREILVAERHFLREQDERIPAFAATLDFPTRIRFNLSLEDPLLRIFVSEKVLGYLQTSAKPEDAMESGMVSKSIQKAQARIAKRASGNEEAASAEEWARKHLSGESAAH
ncbi:MAG: hypothetical protein M5U26_02700 [Planctomycetota bacterium]|nr:hypothetical protein [Planctomycetota bacterium]